MEHDHDPGEGEDDDARSGEILEIARFVLDACFRHRMLAASVGLGVATIGVGGALLVPPVYEASSRILINQDALVTPTLSNPGRTLPRTDPMVGLNELVKRRENLVAIAKEADLVARWEASRQPLFRLKDGITTWLLGPPTEEIKLRSVIGMLEKQIYASPDGEAVIRIGAQWRDPQVCTELAALAQRRLLAERFQQETTVITAAIDILEKEAQKAAAAIDPQLATLQRVRAEARKGSEAASAGNRAFGSARTDAPAGGSALVSRAAKTTKPASPDLSVTNQLEAIRQRIREVQEPWQRKLAELKLQLSDLRGTYGPMHPSVVQQDARIREASAEPAGLAALRDSEQALLSQIQQPAVPVDDAPTVVRIAPGAGRSTAAGSAERAAETAALVIDEPPEVATERSKLSAAIQRYNELNNRLDTARLELTTAELGFKYRYVVVEEPEFPKRPVKPKRAVLVLGSVVAALVAALLAGAIRELLSGRIMAAWQLRRLNLPVLAEVDLRHERASS
jgi:uncharacterized protein involved in exopolysaccharide biosynthesis